MTKTLQAALLAVLLALCVPVSAGATSRIKDLANIEGVRQNQLIGYGLVVGLNGTGENYHTWSGFGAVADREGFVTVYPDAIEKRWSYGRPIIAPMPALAGEPVDDTGFIRRLIDDLVGKGIADPARVYVTGSSRGGLMAYTLACALADRIAAAAALITGMTDLQRDDCRPARPVPIMMIAGTSDTSQPYDGMRFATGRLLSVPDTMEFWRMPAWMHGAIGAVAAAARTGRAVARHAGRMEQMRERRAAPALSRGERRPPAAVDGERESDVGGKIRHPQSRHRDGRGSVDLLQGVRPIGLKCLCLVAFSTANRRPLRLKML